MLLHTRPLPVLAICLLVVLCGAVNGQDSRRRSRNNRNRNRENSSRNRQSSTGTDEVSDDFDSNDILAKFGYLDDLPDGYPYSEDSVNKAITEFQRFNGLDVTGNLDTQTINKMNQPRCGIPDVLKPRQRPLEMRNDGSAHAPLAYHAPGYKWDHTQVTYNIEGFTRQLNTGDQSRSMMNAFQKWADVTPLTFRRTNGDADIMIKFGVGEHGDGAGNAFDGRSGTLAHAFFPGPAPISGDTHFDDDEQWTVREDRGTNLEIVAAHEFGHALGLGHSSTPDALMAPYYSGYDPNYRLHYDDIRGIQQLYGGPPRTRTTAAPRTRAPVTRRPVTRRPPATTRRPGTDGNSRCNIRFDAIEQIHDGKILGFKGRDLYIITRNGPTQKQPIRRLFPRAPRNINAVVYDRYGRNLYFFKGRKYWKYRGYQKASGYPRNLPTPFQRIKAAMQWRDGGIYIFKGRDYIRWTEGLTSNPRGYPRRAREYWRGFPSNPDATFRSYDGYYYVFKFFRYWRFNSRAQLSPGYPKDTKTVWLNCNRSSQLRSRARSQSDVFSWLTRTVNNGVTEN